MFLIFSTASTTDQTHTPQIAYVLQSNLSSQRLRVATPSALRTAMVSSLAKPTVDAGREEVCWCLNINHWHSKALKSEAKTGYMHQSTQDKLVPG